MIKLIKKRVDRTEYWETWQDGASLVVHEGDVGNQGEYVVITTKNQSVHKMMEQASRQKIEKGFTVLDEGHLSDCIIRYHISGFGTVADLDKRHYVEQLMDEVLGWTGNGHCVGGDTGSGTMNVYCRVVDKTLAVSAIEAELDKNGYRDGAAII